MIAGLSVVRVQIGRVKSPGQRSNFAQNMFVNEGGGRGSPPRPTMQQAAGTGSHELRIARAVSLCSSRQP